MDNQKTESGKRLTKKQAVIVLIIGIGTTAITRSLGDSMLVTAFGAAGEITATFALISLFTKKGLRWR